MQKTPILGFSGMLECVVRCGGDPNMNTIYLIFEIHIFLNIPQEKIKIALSVSEKINNSPAFSKAFRSSPDNTRSVMLYFYPKTAILHIFGNFERAQFANKNFR